MTSYFKWLPLFAVLLPSMSQGDTAYKCQNGKAVSYQSTPCSQGDSEEQMDLRQPATERMLLGTWQVKLGQKVHRLEFDAEGRVWLRREQSSHQGEYRIADGSVEMSWNGGQFRRYFFLPLDYQLTHGRSDIRHENPMTAQKLLAP